MQIVSYILATGAAAGFGLSVDLNHLPVNGADIEDFLNKANAAASLLFIGFLFSATSSVFSSLSLPKRSWVDSYIFLFDCLNMWCMCHWVDYSMKSYCLILLFDYRSHTFKTWDKSINFFYILKSWVILFRIKSG